MYLKKCPENILEFNFEGTRFPDDVNNLALAAFTTYCGNFLRSKTGSKSHRTKTVINFNYDDNSDLIGFTIAVVNCDSISSILTLETILQMLDIDDTATIIGFNDSDHARVKAFAKEFRDLVEKTSLNAE